MPEINRLAVDWPKLKARLHREMREFAGGSLRPGLPGSADSMPGWREWHWYRSRPPAEQHPPGLTSADFADAYRSDPPFSAQPDPRQEG